MADAIARRRLAYVHLMNQAGFERIGSGQEDGASARFSSLLTRMRGQMSSTALILAGGFTAERADALISDGVIDLAAFGTHFISNPDLVARMPHRVPLTPADRTTFYGGGSKGYIDYGPYRPSVAKHP